MRQASTVDVSLRFSPRLTAKRVRGPGLWLHVCVRRTALKRFFLCITLPLFARAQTWVPYTARSVETSSIRDSAGSEQSTRKLFREFRSVDGSTASFQESNAGVLSGTIWLACGSIISLDYGKKLATVSKNTGQRRHTHWPEQDQPLGTAMIAGVNATGWPIHIKNGGGAMWYDTNTDIAVKVEVHTETNGTRNEYKKEFTSLDLTSPVDDSKTKLPTGFTIAGSPPVCSPM